MRPEGVVTVLWTRSELIALREAIEITPNFEGRQEVRDFLRVAVRAPRVKPLELDPGDRRAALGPARAGRPRDGDGAGKAPTGRPRP